MSGSHDFLFTDNSDIERESNDFSNLKIGPSIFYPTLYNKTRRIIHQGGQSAGKTVNILAVLAVRAKLEPERVITVTSESLPHLRGGALRDFSRYIAPYFQPEILQHNKTNNYYLFKSGSIIEFKSFEDEQAARGARRHYLYVNEANSFNYLTFRQLDSRTKFQTIIDYNPSISFWAHEKLIGEPGNQLFISDHRMNPFLTMEQHREIENEKDPELWRVYARGLTGNLKGLIFTNWTKIPDEMFPKDAPFFGGLDFGYTNDPTAGVKIARIGDDIYLHELCYETGMPVKDLMQTFAVNGFDSNIPVYCEHDPDMGAQLRRAGMLVYPARKGQGSINAGIEVLKKFRVFYTASSHNIDTERRKYMWLLNPDNGLPTNTPIDQYNHLMDAIRYGVYSHYYRA